MCTRYRIPVALVFLVVIALMPTHECYASGFDSPRANALLLQEGPDILEGGNLLIGGESDYWDYAADRGPLARLRSGLIFPDTTFSFDRAQLGYGMVLALAPAPDGRILVGGSFTQALSGCEAAYILWNNGTVHQCLGPIDGAVNSIAMQQPFKTVANDSASKILIAGSFTTAMGTPRNRIARYVQISGSFSYVVDASFDPGSGANGPIYAMAVQPDGRILIGGEFTSYNGTARNRIARLNSNGSLDVSFDPGSGASGTVYALALQPDGKVVIGGGFSTINGQSHYRIGRLNQNGSLDTSFTLNPGTSVGVINALALQPDGKILFGGAYLGRATAGGTLDASFVFDSSWLNGQVNAITLRANGAVIVGGDFTSPMGTSVDYHINSLTIAADTATQSLVLSPDATSITWQRSGAGPEFWWVDFSMDGGSTWQKGSWSGGAWQLGGLNLLYNQQYSIRARGYAVSGKDNGSATVIESSQSVSLVKPPSAATLAATVWNKKSATIGGTVNAWDAATTVVFEYGPTTAYGSTVSGYAGQVGGHYDTHVQATLDNLPVASTWHYRVKATNTAGTSYGNDMTFTTLANSAPEIYGSPLAIATPGIPYSFTPSVSDRDYDPITISISNKPSWAAFNPSTGALTGTPTDANIGSYDNIVISVSDGLLSSSLPAFSIVVKKATVSPLDGFNPAVNGALTGIALQGDGRAVIIGDFTAVESVARAHIARLNPDGSLDSSFVPATDADSVILAVALQSDGKALVGGSFATIGGASRNGIARLKPDGTLDTTFTPGSGVNGVVRALALQTDGKVLIAGDFTTYNGTPRSRIARLNANGSLDASFDPGAGADAVITALALQPDGRILAAGDFEHFSGAPRGFIARLEGDGRLDTSFDIGTGADSGIYALLLQPDGRIVIGGYFTSFNGSPHSRIARLNADGSLDGTFAPAADQLVKTAIRQGDGRLLIGGDFTQVNGQSRGRIARLNDDGSLDAAFSPGSGANAGVNALALQADDKLLVGGQFTLMNGTAPAYLARLYPDGGRDANFVPALTPMTGFVNSLGLQADGKVLIGGDGFDIFDDPLVRLNRDGSLDAAYDPQVVGSVHAIGLQGNGQALIGGDITSVKRQAQGRIARLNSDGTPDAAFVTGTGANSTVYALAQQPDGRIVIGGYFTSYNGTARNYIARLNNNGSLDATFNVGSGAASAVYSLLLQPDGKILIGGYFTSYNGTPRNRIARLNADGSIDTSFDPGSGALATMYAPPTLALQPDGRILVSSGFDQPDGSKQLHLFRLNPDGSLDTSFNAGLIVGGLIYTIAAQVDGKILIGGAFTSVNGLPCVRFGRLNPDGSLDAAFIPGSGPDNQVSAMLIQNDGKILIGGRFSTLNGVSRRSAARITNTGTSLQALSASADGGTLTWLRQGTGPELGRVEFEQSGDGTTWSVLGSGTRVSGGWQLDGLALPFESNLFLRARGFACTSQYWGGSAGTAEKVERIFLAGIQYPLDVTFSGGGSGTVHSSSTPPSADINCSGTCRRTFDDDTSLTLSASASPGSAFTGWSGACSGSGTCSVTMNAARSVTVSFVPLRTLTIALAGTGSGTVVSTNVAGISCVTGSGSGCSNDYPDGTVVNLSAVEDWTSLFSTWAGADTINAGTCSVVMNAPRGVTATFGPAPNARIGLQDYATLQAACSAAPNGATILMKNIVFLEYVAMNPAGSSAVYTLKGGFTDFSVSATGYTTIKGSLKVRNGRLNVDRLTVKP